MRPFKMLPSNYELDTYLDALQFFPEDADVLEIERSRAFWLRKIFLKPDVVYTARQ